MVGRELDASSLNGIPLAQVAHDCEDDQGFVEVLTTLTVNARGGWVDGLTLQYTANETEYELPVEWSYVACGTAINEKDAC